MVAKIKMKRVRLNAAGVAAFMAGREVEKALSDRGRNVARRANANAGPYAKGGGGYRVASVRGKTRVGTDYSFAHWDEWGNIHYPPRGSLRRAVASVGLRSRLS